MSYLLGSLSSLRSGQRRITAWSACAGRANKFRLPLANVNRGRAEEPSLFNCTSGRFQPLTVTGVAGHGGELETALEVLRPIFSETDLLEPFDRIAKVVAELERQESGGVEMPQAKVPPRA